MKTKEEKLKEATLSVLEELALGMGFSIDVVMAEIEARAEKSE